VGRSLGSEPGMIKRCHDAGGAVPFLICWLAIT
jgi:hypothetical protein